MFLNIDLDVRSRQSLGPLAAAWPWAQQPADAGGRPNRRWLIVGPQPYANTAEAAARVLLDMIEALPAEARRCWKRASRRTFDIGIQAGTAARAFEDVQLTAKTLLRIGGVGARVQVTVYAPAMQ